MICGRDLGHVASKAREDGDALAAEGRRRYYEGEDLGAEEEGEQEVADGAGREGGRTVGDRVLDEPSDLRIGDEVERLVGELREEEDCVENGDDDKRRVELVGGRRIHVARLPCIIDLANLVTTTHALSDEHHDTREDGEVRHEVRHEQVDRHEDDLGRVTTSSGNLPRRALLRHPVGAQAGQRS